MEIMESETMEDAQDQMDADTGETYFGVFEHQPTTLELLRLASIARNQAFEENWRKDLFVTLGITQNEKRKIPPTKTPKDPELVGIRRSNRRTLPPAPPLGVTTPTFDVECLYGCGWNTGYFPIHHALAEMRKHLEGNQQCQRIRENPEGTEVVRSKRTV